MFSLQGSCIHYRHFPVRISTQGNPCSHYREWVCSDSLLLKTLKWAPKLHVSFFKRDGCMYCILNICTLGLLYICTLYMLECTPIFSYVTRKVTTCLFLTLFQLPYTYKITKVFCFLCNVCFKKTWTNYSTVSLLWFVQVFLKQMLLSM